MKKRIYMVTSVIMLCLLGYLLKPFFVTDVVKDVPEEVKEKLLQEVYGNDGDVSRDMIKLAEENTVIDPRSYFVTGDKAFYKKYHYFGKEIEEYLVPYAIYFCDMRYAYANIEKYSPSDYATRRKMVDFVHDIRRNQVEGLAMNWWLRCHAEIFVYVDGVLQEGNSGSYGFSSRLYLEAEVDCEEGLWISRRVYGDIESDDLLNIEVFDTWEKKWNEKFVFDGFDIKKARKKTYMHGLIQPVALEVVSDRENDFQSGGRIFIRWKKGKSMIEENAPFQCEVYIMENYK